MVITEQQQNYIIDASSIISQKSDEPFRRNVYKGLWQRIEELMHTQRMVTCSEVALELADEEIKLWISQVGCQILPIDDEIQENVTKVVTTNPQLVDFKEIKSSTDAFLIATAMKYNLAVITEENSKKPKKIPAVCKNLGVSCYNILGLCELEHWEL